MTLKKCFGLLWQLKHTNFKLIPMIKNSNRPYIVTVKEMSASRSFRTDYINTTGRTLIVSLTCKFETLVNTDFCMLHGRVNGVIAGDIGINTPIVTKSFLQLIVFVPPGSTYNMYNYIQGTGAVTLRKWTEAY